MPRTQAGAAPKADAKNNPRRSTRKDFEAGADKVGQDQTRHMKSTGPAKKALESRHIEPVDRPVSKDKLESLRFMEDELEIVVADTTDPTAERIVEVWNDGVPQRFERNLKQKVKRKYVEVLARAKVTRHSNEKYKDGEGHDAYRYPSHTALRYPFTVIYDPAGDKGRTWLESVLREA